MDVESSQHKEMIHVWGDGHTNCPGLIVIHCIHVLKCHTVLYSYVSIKNLRYFITISWSRRNLASFLTVIFYNYYVIFNQPNHIKGGCKILYIYVCVWDPLLYLWPLWVKSFLIPNPITSLLTCYDVIFSESWFRISFCLLSASLTEYRHNGCLFYAQWRI